MKEYNTVFQGHITQHEGAHHHIFQGHIISMKEYNTVFQGHIISMKEHTTMYFRGTTVSMNVILCPYSENTN